MKQPSIYADAETKINYIRGELIKEHHYTPAEMNYKVIKVEEEMIILEIHDTLKELVHKQYELVGSGHNEVEFIKKDDVLWEVLIKSGGVESHFFARLMEMVIINLNEEKKDRINLGKKLIESAFETVLRNMTPSNGYKLRIWYKKGIYYASITTDITKFTFNSTCPEKLKSEITEKLPGIFNILFPIK